MRRSAAVVSLALILAGAACATADAAPISKRLLDMWQGISGEFAPDDEIEVPRDPIYTTPDGKSMVFRPDREYEGEDATMSNASIVDWERVQTELLERAGGFRPTPEEADDERPTHSLASLWLSRARYDGLAIFGGARIAELAFTFGPPDGAADSSDDESTGFELRYENGPKITSSAIFGVTVDVMGFNGARIGGLNMRGTRAGTFLVEGSLFRSWDVTGARLGSDEGLSTIWDSVFDGVWGNRFAQGPDGMADRFNEPVQIRRVAFVRTRVRGAELSSARLTGVVWSHCELTDVNLTGARITGTDPADGGGMFEPTFDGSELTRVLFDGATLTNVSFAGQDLSRASFDGAILDNVDFTDAEGLQHVDWSKVKVVGPVYGLGEYGRRLAPESRRHVRSMTFDGSVPRRDKDTGLDVDPRTGLLVDPTGVRLRHLPTGELIPFDADGHQLRTKNRNLVWTGSELLDPVTKEAFGLDLRTGKLIRRGR